MPRVFLRETSRPVPSSHVTMEALDEEKARHESDKGEEIGEEEEKDAFLPQVQPPPEKARPPGLSRRYCFSVAVNTGSAVGLVGCYTFLLDSGLT